MSTTSKQSGQPQTVNTSCKECIFADYDDITQIGCSADILQNFHDSGAVIEAYDEDKEFFVILGSACPYYRTSKWKYADDVNRLEIARSELRMDYEAVIVVGSGRVEDSIGSLMEQSKRPSKIHIIAPNPNISFDRSKLSECLVPWTLETRVENQEHNKDRSNLRNIIRKVKSPLVTYIKSGTIFEDRELFSNLEKKIIDERFEFGLIRISPSEFIVPKTCYDYFNFMVESKFDSICDIEEQEGMIDLCNLQ